MNLNFVAPCMFGVEGLLATELKRMGCKNVSAENGRVKFDGDENTLAKANVFSRLSERILINLKEFKALTFDSLFDEVKKIPFENFISKNDAFPVVGYSINSSLHSVPNCQKIIKKAIVERLKEAYKISWFKEDTAKVLIRFSIIKDSVCIMIDTSGEALHKRGYRAHSSIAPIKETLAAAMCELARIFPDTVLYDPFCGSGTILIEAALMAMKKAPGLNRKFLSENFSFLNKNAFKNARTEALDLIEKNISFKAFGYDISDECIALTKENAKKAGVENLIEVKKQDIKDLKLPEDRLKVITNPPYGERLLDIKKAEELYKIEGKVMPELKGHGYFIISPHDEFESFFGREATKKRKLYNGMLKCSLYMYF